jgi:hypothetical protein
MSGHPQERRAKRDERKKEVVCDLDIMGCLM